MATFHARGIRNAANHILGITVFETGVNHVIPTVGQLNIFDILRVEFLVPLLNSQLIQLRLKWIQILIIRTVDSRTKIQLQTVFIIHLIGDATRRKEV